MRLPRSVVLLTSALLFAAVAAIWIANPDTRNETDLLFVLPVAFCALAFGRSGGLLAGLLAVAFLLVWDLQSQAGIDAVGIGTRSLVFLGAGGVLGASFDRERALQARTRRYYDLSLDLLCTANFDGYFEWVNPAWEEVLGYPREELLARPFIEFVHPEDRRATEAEVEKLVGDRDTRNFRNRYRAADGSYHWLEWNVHVALEERRLYAAARDVSSLKQAEDVLDGQKQRLESMVAQRTQALEDSRLETLQRLALAAEYRDEETFEHTERVGRNSALIAQSLGLPTETVALIRRAAPLHDLGKLGIPDAILHKPDQLGIEELAQMREHTSIGAKILADPRFAVLRMARSIALTHHERFDGEGYPAGLQGEEIPLSGRIVAVADVFDALTHARPYKEAWPLGQVVAKIELEAGSHFDPDVVQAFAALDHARLLEPVERYDLDLPLPPPLRARVLEPELMLGKV